jgi:hypothetical protein
MQLLKRIAMVNFVMYTYHNYFKNLKSAHGARHWWLTPIILATQEAKIRKIEVQASPNK